MPRRKESAEFDDGLLALADSEMDEGPPRPTTPVSRVPKPSRPVGGGPTCPSCKRSLPLGSVICVDCGLNLKTGRSILTSLESGLDDTYAKAESVTRWISWLIPWGLYPVASEAFGTCKPYAIRAIAAVTVLVSMYFLVLFYTGSASFDSWQDLMLWSGRFDRSRIPAELLPPGMNLNQIKPGDFGLGTYHPYQLVTHALLHADPFHLAGNMVFLLVFGSRVNALIGNVLSVLVCPLLAVFAALFQMAAGANAFIHPMLGASGAVMGLAGMYLVLFPLHKVHMLIWYRFGLLVGFRLSFKIFAIRGFWVVLFYIGLDVLYTILGAEDNVARWAHMGGFFIGAVLAMSLMMTRLVNARGGDLLTTVFGRYAWGIVGRPGRETATPVVQDAAPVTAQSPKSH
jgi:membrane associated rhomboid family serine protease